MTESSEPIDPQLKQEAIAWHLRLTSGEADAELEAEFENWRRADCRHEQAYREIERLWSNLPEALLADRRRRNSQPQQYRHANAFQRFGVAAVVLISVLVLSLYTDHFSYSWADYRTTTGKQTSVVLADGSVAYLNTDSAINVAFSANLRKVEVVHGEVEFEVVHDAAKPFRVSAGSTVTEALGTRFIVRNEDGRGSVSLLEGKVRTNLLQLNGQPSAEVFLQTGQQTRFDSEFLSKPDPFDLNALTAWHRGWLIMNFVPLSQVVDEVNRYRRGRIVVLDQALAAHKVNVAINLDHIDDWLAGLPDTLPVTVRRAGPWVWLQARSGGVFKS